MLKMPMLDVVDSHIHLFPQSELDSLAWCKEGHPLRTQCSVQQYHEAVELLSQIPQYKLKGYVFVETDRKSHLDTEDGWNAPLEEFDWIERIVTGNPRPGEDHGSEDAEVCLAIILWAPVALGADAMERFLTKVRERSAGGLELLKGFRYLVQDKPRGTMLTEKFIESLRWMGRNGYSFDLGVDARSGGIWQLEEAGQMVERVHHGIPEHDKVRIVLNHMCKPDMGSRGSDMPDSAFASWKESMAKLSSFSHTVVKISGGFSEIDGLPNQAEQEALDFWSRSELLSRTAKWVELWLRETLTLFGSSRVMFGSDWPVCTVGGGSGVAWMNWFLVAKAFAERYLDGQGQYEFWSGTAIRAYNIRNQ